jgi:peptidoglycan/LPS O-acetylase OafA/YrhL
MKKKYIHRVDAVRGIAILLVLSYHTLLLLYPGYEANTYSNNGILLIKDAKSFLLNFNPIGQGWIGVELFLLISGFLIHFIYLQNQNEFKWVNFYSKRFWRIYPPYLIVLLFLFILRPDFSTSGITNLFSHLFLIHNLSDNTFFAINPSFWSIALESQLYLIYPAYLFSIKQFYSFKTTIILLSILISFILIEFFFAKNSLSFGTFVLKFWFVWAVGAFLADRYYQNKIIFKKPIFWFVFFYFLFFVFKLFYFSNYFILIPASLSCLALMETILYSHILDKYIVNRMLIKFLSFTGLISYSIYLIHQPFLNDLFKFYNPNTNFEHINNFISIIFTYATIFAISYFLYKLVELKSIEYGKLFRRYS